MDEKWQWLAGIIDAEGSFSLDYQIVKRGKYQVSVRRARMRIKTSDSIIIPYISYILDRNYTRPCGNYEVCLRGPLMSRIISIVLPYLYIKREHAILCQKAYLLKQDNLSYTKNESIIWHECYERLSKINKRGKEAICGTEIKDHHFSYAWLAGLIDGDGSITTGKFNNNNRKPYIKISLTNHFCINYLANKLKQSASNGGSRGNRRIIKQIRLMSNAIIEIIPKLLPYLRYKYDRAKLAYSIAVIRRDQGFGNQIDSRISPLIDSLTWLNNNKSHEIIYKNKKLILIYDVNNKFFCKCIHPDLMIFCDELGKNPKLFRCLLSHRYDQNHPKYKIRPQSCKIRRIMKKLAEPFYNEFHYQGYVNSKFHFGVFYNDKLIACLSVKSPTRQLSGDWEISRMTCHSDYRIYGIWSFLMRNYLTFLKGKLVTFSDNRLMSGKVYEKMGFLRAREVNPDYYWVRNGVRFHKSGLRKRKSERSQSLTETQLREREGYHKIYDLGKIKWEINPG